MIRPQVVETPEAEAERVRNLTRREVRIAEQARPLTPAEPSGPVWRAQEATADIRGTHLSWLYGPRSAA